jgi:hypothetical protein
LPRGIGLVKKSWNFFQVVEVLPRGIGLVNKSWNFFQMVEV